MSEWRTVQAVIFIPRGAPRRVWVLNTRSARYPDALFSRKAQREERYLTDPFAAEPETAWKEAQAWLVYALVPKGSARAMEVLAWSARIGNTEEDADAWMNAFNAETGERTAMERAAKRLEEEASRCAEGEEARRNTSEALKSLHHKTRQSIQEATRRREAAMKRREAEEARRRAEEQDRERRRAKEGCTALLVGVSRRRATVEYVSDREGLWVRSHGREVTTDSDTFVGCVYSATVWNDAASKLVQVAIAGVSPEVAAATMLVSKFSSVTLKDPHAKRVYSAISELLHRRVFVDKGMVSETIRRQR